MFTLKRNKHMVMMFWLVPQGRPLWLPMLCTHSLHPKMQLKGPGQRKHWTSNLSWYSLMAWCTYPKNETLVHKQHSLHQLHHHYPSQRLRSDFTFNTYVIQVTKTFSEWKQVHVGMEPSKTSQTRWERHHNTKDVGGIWRFRHNTKEGGC